MPTKVNPIRAEQVCGLARVARGHLFAILETAHTQFFERDLTNSSVERLAWRDLLHLTGYILESANQMDFSAWTPKPVNPVEESAFYRYQTALIRGVPDDQAYQDARK